MGAPPVVRQRRVDTADAPEVESVVSRLEDDHELGLAHDRRGREDPRQRALLERQLLAREEEKRGVCGEGRPLLGDPAGDLDHHGDAALHVAGAEADHAPVLDPPGQVALLGDGVDVARQEDEGLARPRRFEQQSAFVPVDECQGNLGRDVGERGRLVATHRRDVDQLERTLGQGRGHERPSIRGA